MSVRGAPALRPALLAGLALLAVALGAGCLGNLSRGLNGSLAAGLLLAVALLMPRAPGRGRLVGVPILAVALPVVAAGDEAGVLASLGAALFFLGLSLLAADDDGLPDALLPTALLFAVYRLLVATVPPAWHAEQAVAVYASWFIGAGLMLGPTALGLPLVVLFGLFAVCRSHPHPQPLPLRGGGEQGARLRPAFELALWLGGLAAAVGGYVWLQPPLGSWLLLHWPGGQPPLTLTYLESLPLLFGLLWLVSLPALLGRRPPRLGLLSAGGGWRTAAGLALVALAGLALTLDPSVPAQRGTVLIHDSGHLDWTRPTFDRFGPQSSGDFALLPDYLAAYGYEARIGALTAENLAGAQVVVLVNLPEELGDEEADRLLEFVAAGGGLIIWGEHTGLGRIREPTNALLARLPGTPLRLRFDSAVPARQGWAEGLSLLPWPPLYGLADDLDLVIAVGASLDIQPPARPLIVGRFGHSDRGDASNRGRNYVGDMRYNFGERLGDVVLAAAVDHGRGRVVLLGDTTPLGSVNLMTTMPFQARLLDWVTAGAAQGGQQLLRSGWLGVLLLAGAGVLLGRRPDRVAAGAAALVLLLALVLAARLNGARATPPAPQGALAYIDAGHLARFDRLLWEEESIGGLAYNLARNGLLPMLLPHLEPEVLAEAQLLVVIAPAHPFSGREVETVARWVEQGGKLLITAGWEEIEGSRPLLDRLGLEVGHIPLGPAEVERVVFHEAWPVAATADGEGQPLLRAYDLPVVLYRPLGRGGVVLVGDSSFVLSGNLEAERSVQVGNVLFLRDLLQQTLGLPGAQAGGGAR